jgi:RHS repeat-associated protein
VVDASPRAIEGQALVVGRIADGCTTTRDDRRRQLGQARVEDEPAPPARTGSCSRRRPTRLAGRRTKSASSPGARRACSSTATRCCRKPALRRSTCTSPSAITSSAFVIDKESSEVVERTSYQAFGATESDYRPDRWGAAREAFKFTGKEEDIEVGATYFGARYFNSRLGRWMSADPLTIHGLGGDLNPYAYVAGRVSSFVDPFGLDCVLATADSGGTHTTMTGACGFRGPIAARAQRPGRLWRSSFRTPLRFNSGSRTCQESSTRTGVARWRLVPASGTTACPRRTRGRRRSSFGCLRFVLSTTSGTTWGSWSQAPSRRWFFPSSGPEPPSQGEATEVGAAERLIPLLPVDRFAARSPLPPECRAMTTFEKAVLEILSQSSSALGWYQIERRLSNTALAERPHLPGVLARLGELGLIEEGRFDSEPCVRYLITQAGRDGLRIVGP